MPICRPDGLRRISQEEFKELSHEVMGHVFAIHRELGRFFDERIYKRSLAERMPGIKLEQALTVSHETFTKSYFIDVLVHDGGLFEFKTTDAIHPRHTGQAINYLLLSDLAHGKIINLRSERVEHRFVNCLQRLDQLRHFKIDHIQWDEQIEGASLLNSKLEGLLTDWGTGLEISLYEEALTHFLGGEETVLRPVPVIGSKGHLADQIMRMTSPNTAFKITALPDRLDAFEDHARRLLKHTALKAIVWANITHSQVLLKTLK